MFKFLCLKPQITKLAMLTMASGLLPSVFGKRANGRSSAFFVMKLAGMAGLMDELLCSVVGDPALDQLVSMTVVAPIAARELVRFSAHQYGSGEVHPGVGDVGRGR